MWSYLTSNTLFAQDAKGKLGLRKRDLVTVFVLLLAYAGYMLLLYKRPGPVISISTGRVRGAVRSSRSGNEYFEFLRIPYARAPVGDFRFEPPQQPQKWKGVRDASRYGAACLQLDIVTGYVYGKEDCLFINVFVQSTLMLRNEKTIAQSKKRSAVLVFIHGGLFTSGSADVVGAELMMDEEIIFVTFQYRFAALGFLNMGNEHIRGNMGLKDQLMALKWIQENIGKFNGDPERVTIFGESAGGASVHYHMLSPKSRGLFTKGISQSGTALNMWFLQKKPEAQGQRFAKRLNCLSESAFNTSQCLKSVNAYDIINLHYDLLKPPRDQLDVFVPTIESVMTPDTFIVEHPLKTISSNNFTKVPWIMGVNADEGLIHSGEVIYDAEALELVTKDWDDFSARLFFFEKDASISRRIRDFYFPQNSFPAAPLFDESNDTSSTSSLASLTRESAEELFLPELTNMFSDRVFFSSNHKTAMLHGNHSPVYTYIFSHQGEIDLVQFLLAMRGDILHIAFDLPLFYIKDWIDRNVWGIDPRKYGVCHGEEMIYQFSVPIVPFHRPTSKDYTMSRSFNRAWVDFANDVYPLRFHNVTWNPIDPNEGELRYMNMNLKNPGMIQEPWTRRVNFWNSLNLY